MKSRLKKIAYASLDFEDCKSKLIADGWNQETRGIFKKEGSPYRIDISGYMGNGFGCIYHLDEFSPNSMLFGFYTPEEALQWLSQN